MGGEGRLGFLDLWSVQKPWRNRYLTPVVDFGEVRRAQLAKYNLLTSALVPPGIFSERLRSVQMLKREWGAESNGKLPHPFVPSKTAAWVPEFAVEDLPLSRSADLVPELAVKDLPLGRILMMMIPRYLNFSTFSNYKFSITIFWVCTIFCWRDIIYLVFSEFTSKPIACFHEDFCIFSNGL